jgi:hypothetical protein
MQMKSIKSRENPLVRSDTIRGFFSAAAALFSFPSAVSWMGVCHRKISPLRNPLPLRIVQSRQNDSVGTGPYSGIYKIGHAEYHAQLQMASEILMMYGCETGQLCKEQIEKYCLITELRGRCRRLIIVLRQWQLKSGCAVPGR